MVSIPVTTVSPILQSVDIRTRSAQIFASIFLLGVILSDSRQTFPQMRTTPDSDAPIPETRVRLCWVAPHNGYREYPHLSI